MVLKDFLLVKELIFLKEINLKKLILCVKKGNLIIIKLYNIYVILYIDLYLALAILKVVFMFLGV